MPAKHPTDTGQIESLLRGELAPADAERLSTELADDGRVSEVAEGLSDDTLMSDVKKAHTATDPDTEQLAVRLAARLKPAVNPAAVSVTVTALPSTDSPVLVGEDEPTPAALEYFKIDRVLGQGGMGTVYLADDTRLGRKVAVKTLKASVARKAGAKERFLREARLAAALEHDCVVPIYYVGEAAGIPFLAMPLLKGQALDEYLAARGGKLPVVEAVRVAAQVASGLAAAHAAGLIHRDIKPSNIWVDDGTGRARILDFGLARSAGDDMQLTASGMIVGTPAYMPPEQARGRSVDHRADLFSLGVVLYQMLVGRRPFTGTDAVAILSSLALDTPAPPHELNREVPPHVSALVMKLLEKEPARRPQSAAEVVAALTPAPPVAVVPRSWRETGPAEAKPAAKARTESAPADAGPARKRPLAAWIALGALLLAGGAAAVYQFAFGTKDGTLIVEVAEDADVRFKNGKLEVYDDSGKKLYTLEPSEKNKTLPPGKYRVKVVGADGVKLDTETFEIEKKGKAWVKVTAAPPPPADPKKPDPKQPDPVPSVPGVPLALRKATWPVGPAGNVLPGLVARPAILDGIGRWQVVPTNTGFVWVTSFSPDGKWVATADADYVRVYDATTGEFKALGKRTNGTPSPHTSVLTTDWSPDSNWLRVADFGGPNFTNGDVFAPDGTHSPVPLIQHAAPDFGWNPKFPVFACRQQNGKVAIFDPAKDKPTEVGVGEVASGAWAPDGERLLVVLADKTGVLVGRDGKVGAKFDAGLEFNAGGGTHLRPEWAADGKTVAALTADNVVGIWNVDGKLAAKTGKHEKPVLGLYWKPDGKLLAVSDADGKRHFWKPDGTGDGVADTKDATPGFAWAKDGKGFFTPGKFWPAVGNPSFTSLMPLANTWSLVSPDQKRVLYYSADRRPALGELAGGELKPVEWKPAADGMPTWNRDGTRFAFTDFSGVALYDARDAKKVVRLGGGASGGNLSRAVFSPKGDRLAVASNLGTVLVCEPTGKILRALTIPAQNVPGWASGAALAANDLQWHPDGKHLAVTAGMANVTVYNLDDGKAIASTTLEGVPRPGGSAIFSPANPDHLLIAHPDVSALWRWKVEKEPLQKFAGLGKLIPAPDGKRLLSLQAGGGIHGNDFISAALVSPDLKDRDTAGTKDGIANGNHPGPSLAWHPDGKHLVVTRLAEARSIQIRSLDGKVTEEIKPDGIDVTWLEWVEPVARRNVLVGRIGQGPDTYLFDLATKKLSPVGKVNGELTVSPDGRHLIALEGSTLTYWNVDTKAVDQKVVVLPNGEFVTLSAAGEVLEKSANADNYYRYLVEDKTGKLLLKTPAEMAPNLPEPK